MTIGDGTARIFRAEGTRRSVPQRPLTDRLIAGVMRSAHDLPGASVRRAPRPLSRARYVT